MSILKLKNRKSKKNARDLPDLYDFSHMTAARQAKEAAGAAELPDLPNLSSLRSAKKVPTREEDLPDLLGIAEREDKNKKGDKAKREAEKRRSRIIKNSLKQLERYYISHNYRDSAMDDYYSAFSDTDEKFSSGNGKMRRRDLTRKYSHLKFQTLGFVLIVVMLTVGLFAYIGRDRNFEYEAIDVSVLIQDENILSTLDVVEYDPSVIDEEFKKYNIRFINQLNEGLPNGCEAVSLTMVLSRYIRDITAGEVVEKYLPRKDIGIYNGVYIGEDPTYYYIGNPAGKGYGIFAEGLAQAAKNVLTAYNLNGAREVLNISGCTNEELFGYVEDGYPVVVWCTLGMTPVMWGTYSWHLPTGQIYRYPGNLHCCVLVDVTENEVVLYDPREGEVTYNKSQFLKIWTEIGPYVGTARQAIVIK